MQLAASAGSLRYCAELAREILRVNLDKKRKTVTRDGEKKLPGAAVESENTRVGVESVQMTGIVAASAKFRNQTNGDLPTRKSGSIHVDKASGNRSATSSHSRSAIGLD